MINNIDDVLNLKEEWKSEMKNIQGCKVVLVGAGCTSSFILERFHSNLVYPIVFADNDKNKENKIIHSKNDSLTVISIEKAVEKYSDAFYYITTQLAYKELYDQLLLLGVDENKIIKHDLICQFGWETNYKEFIAENKSALIDLLNSLDDEKSKECLLGRLAFLITRRRSYAVNIRSKHQYFEEFIDYNKLKLFVDVGAYIGDSVMELKKLFPASECSIIAFEMDDELYERAKKNLLTIDNNLYLIKKGVSDKDGISMVKSSLGQMQTISENVFENLGGNPYKKIEVVKIDSSLKDYMDMNGKDCFLKMDIEGAEMSALKGAEAFIMSVHPQLAICIYHKEDDVIKISDFLKECNPNYKFKIRHYSDNQTETVLYAI